MNRLRGFPGAYDGVDGSLTLEEFIGANRHELIRRCWLGPGDVLGRVITEVTVPQTTRNQGQEIMGLLQRGETWTGEFLVQSRQGRVFPAHVTDSPVLDGRGRLIGIVGISTDMMSRRPDLRTCFCALI